LPDREVFETLKEGRAILEDHRMEYDHRRPHSSPGYRTPAEFAAARGKPGVASLAPIDALPIPGPVLSYPLNQNSGARQRGWDKLRPTMRGAEAVTGLDLEAPESG